MICKGISHGTPSRSAPRVWPTNLDLAVQDLLQGFELGIDALVIHRFQKACALLDREVRGEGDAAAHGIIHGLVAEPGEEGVHGTVIPMMTALGGRERRSRRVVFTADVQLHLGSSRSDASSGKMLD